MRTSPDTPSVNGCDAFVEPAAVEREAQRLHHVDRERALPCRAHAGRDRQRRLRRLQLDRVAYQAGQSPRHDAEQLVDLGPKEPGAELVDQCVVWRKPERLGQHLGTVARQGDDLLEVRREQRKVRLLLGLDPADLGPGGRLGETRDQRQRGRDCVVALTPHLAQVGELPVLELGLGGLRPLDQA